MAGQSQSPTADWLPCVRLMEASEATPTRRQRGSKAPQPKGSEGLRAGERGRNGILLLEHSMSGTAPESKKGLWSKASGQGSKRPFPPQAGVAGAGVNLGLVPGCHLHLLQKR